jgi:anti-anti-sigma factor
MKFSEETIGAVRVFHLEGKIMGGPESQAMCDYLKSLVDTGTRSLVMDFDNVQWINSNGVGIVIACLTGLRNSGGDLCFANVHGAAKHYFEITRLDTVVKVFGTIEEAVASFSVL